jgi:peptidoglycan/LPS O-acetylase OafA/YrhL
MPAVAKSAGLVHPKRLAELDGLRALAILPVMLNHSYPVEGWFGWVRFAGEAGWVGVDLFFVLSGYLITGILLDAVDRPHYYRNFIVRRTLRIFPLYYASLGLFSLLTKLVSPIHWSALQAWGGIGWFLCYLGNVRAAWLNRLPNGLAFDVLWSLQVEEQFYLFYPLVILLFSRRQVTRLLIGCIVVGPLLRFCLSLFVPGSATACYVLTPCRMDALAMGGLVAVIARSPGLRLPSREKLRLAAMISGVSAVGTYIASYALWRSRFAGTLAHVSVTTICYFLIDVSAAVLLALIVFWPSGRLPELLRRRPLVYTGQIAYGLYLLHAPAAWAARKAIAVLARIDVPEHSLASVAITMVAGYIAAGISWRFFESPILALKDRFTIS